MYDNLEHPEVTNALNTGYPSWVRPMPVCPVCGDECSTIYTDINGTPVGCDQCLYAQDADRYYEDREGF